MKIPKGIEGDYIETRNNHLFFDIKGYHHPKERKICFIRFYPDKTGDRVRDNKIYKKIYDLNERYSLLRDKYPQYLFYSNQIDLELQGVRSQDIKKIYTPKDCFNNLKTKTSLSSIEKKSKELCELFIYEGETPEDSIGISGSLMIGLNRSDSDIDIIIYGTETSLNFRDKLGRIFERSKVCERYNLDDYKSHYNWRVGGSNILFEDFLKTEKRKFHQGKFHNTDFFIRYIKSPENWKGTYYDFQYKNLGRVKIEACVIDSTDSIFTPCNYKIKSLKLLNTESISENFKLEEITEINSFRGRFTEQAMDGEIILVEGKLEEVNYRDREKYYRILLTDQVKDKMLILN
jgi:predicted nucleotidyltransferase